MTLKIVISGFGTVGQGVAEVLERKRDFIQRRFHRQVRIVAVFDSRSLAYDNEGLDPQELLEKKTTAGMVGDPRPQDMCRFLRDIDFDVLVEVSPTNIKTGGEGLLFIREALNKGAHVITVNKGPLALHFRELNGLAKKKNVQLRFEGAVGGAMPIINLCKENFMGERILTIQGILNGTCNFILSRMDKGLPFGQALKEAQELGYAEADPSYDIDGIDSASKVAILANAVFDRDVTFSDVSVTGITAITEDAISLAGDQNMVIRLIGEVSPDKLEVAPRLIPKGHPLSLSGTLNMAQINTDLAGPITISGRGAGRIETASAIFSDLVAILEAERQ